MRTYIEKIESGIQIRIEYEDENMTLYDSLAEHLDNHNNVKVGEKAQTFETPIYHYKYQEIPFSLLFDEMCDETFAFVDKEYDYHIIEKLLREFQIK